MITGEEKRGQLKKWIMDRVGIHKTIVKNSSVYYVHPELLAELLIDILGGELEITFKK